MAVKDADGCGEVWPLRWKATDFSAGSAFFARAPSGLFSDRYLELRDEINELFEDAVALPDVVEWATDANDIIERRIEIDNEIVLASNELDVEILRGDLPDYQYLVAEHRDEFESPPSCELFAALAIDAWARGTADNLTLIESAKCLAEVETCLALAALLRNQRDQDEYRREYFAAAIDKKDETEKSAASKRAESARNAAFARHSKNTPLREKLMQRYRAESSHYQSINEAAEALAEGSRFSVPSIRRWISVFVKANPECAPGRT